MTRYDVINTLIRKHEYESYLEIGVGSGECLRHVQCRIKHGIDPAGSLATYRMSSDEFFGQNEAAYDIVFIDGLHLAEQASLDIDNSLCILSDGGAVVMHDCLPVEEWQQSRDRKDPKKPWTGDVWKAFAELRFSRPDLDVFTIDCDWGCGVILKGEQEVLPRPTFLDWDYYIDNMQSLMNVVGEEEWLKCMRQDE